MDLGAARGWTVWPLASGDWAWSAWVAPASDRRSGIEPSEGEAGSAALRALEALTSDAAAAGLSRREVSVSGNRGNRWDPQA
jgi:hypothetical protein